MASNLPAYALADVRAAAGRARGIKLGYTAAIARLMGSHPEAVFDTLAECYAFARDVLLGLDSRDFIRPVSIPNTSASASAPGVVEQFDEYAVRLTPSVLTKHGLTTQTTWYLKLILRNASEPVFCLSLHKLERLARCHGGAVSPEW